MRHKIAMHIYIPMCNRMVLMIKYINLEAMKPFAGGMARMLSKEMQVMTFSIEARVMTACT